jgi:hypothetical protein
VWSDGANAQADVYLEASALRSVVLLSAEFPRQESQMRVLIRRQMDVAVSHEWPASARRNETLMIGVQDRPFSGRFRIKPTVLVQVEP